MFQMSHFAMQTNFNNDHTHMLRSRSRWLHNSRVPWVSHHAFSHPQLMFAGLNLSLPMTSPTMLNDLPRTPCRLDHGDLGDTLMTTHIKHHLMLAQRHMFPIHTRHKSSLRDS